jgi:hypothetical protein
MTFKSRRVSAAARSAAIAASIFVAASVPAGAAEILSFAYEYGGSGSPATWVTGTILGTLESNGNTFDATQWLSINFPQARLAENPVVPSEIVSVGGGSPIITVDGSAIDFALPTSGYVSGRVGCGSFIADPGHAPQILCGGGSGFSQSLWSAKVTDAPEPASLTLLGVGIAGLRVLSRRRRA